MTTIDTERPLGGGIVAPRGPACLTLVELHQRAREPWLVTDDERVHLTGCDRCLCALRAFVDVVEIEPFVLV